VPVEVLTWRTTVSGPRPEVRLRHAESRGDAGRGAIKGRRPLYAPDRRAFVEAVVYDRYALPPGATVAGPAALEERESTAVIGPGAVGRIDADLNLVVDLPS
jgi:N-methylhydantoinase A